MSQADSMQIFFLENASFSQLQETLDELFSRRDTHSILNILDCIPKSNLTQSQLKAITKILEGKFLCLNLDFLSKYLFLLYDRLENEPMARFYLNRCFSEIDSTSLYSELASQYMYPSLGEFNANYYEHSFSREYSYDGVLQSYSIHSAFPNEIGRNLTLLRTPYGDIIFDCGARCGTNGSQPITTDEFLDFLARNGSSIDAIKAVIISHAHLDHYGSLTTIINSGISLTKVFIGTLTRELISTAATDMPALKNCRPLSAFFVYQNKLKIKAFENGHILGSEGYIVSFDNINIVYTGDFCLHDQHTVKGLALNSINEYPPILKDGIDSLIIESTYGKSTQQFLNHTHAEMVLQHFVHVLSESSYKVFFPAFAIGRSQEIALILNSENKILLDGLSVKISKAYESLTGLKIFNENTRYNVETEDKSRNLYTNDIIISSSGMLAKNSTSSNYIEQFFDSEEKIVIILTGYMDSAEDAYGNILLEQWKRKNNILLNISLSAHASYDELLDLINGTNPQNVIAIHGTGIAHKKVLTDCTDSSSSSSKATLAGSDLLTPSQNSPLLGDSKFSSTEMIPNSRGIDNLSQANTLSSLTSSSQPNNTSQEKADNRSIEALLQQNEAKELVFSTQDTLHPILEEQPQEIPSAHVTSENVLLIPEPQLQVKMVNIQKAGLSLEADGRDFNQSRPLKMACNQFIRLLKRFPSYQFIYDYLATLSDYKEFWEYIDNAVRADFNCAIFSVDKAPAAENNNDDTPIINLYEQTKFAEPAQSSELTIASDTPRKRKKKYPIHKVARDFGLSSKLIIKILLNYGIPVKNHMQPLSDHELSIIFEFLTQHSQEEGFLEKFSKAPTSQTTSEPSAVTQSDNTTQISTPSKNLIDIMIVKCQDGDYYVSEKFAGKVVFYKLLMGRSHTSIHFPTIEQARIVAEEMRSSKLLDNPLCQIVEYDINDYKKEPIKFPPPVAHTVYDNNGLIIFAVKEGKSKKFVYREGEEQFKYIDTHEYKIRIHEKLAAINNPDFDYQRLGMVQGYEAAETAHLPSIYYEIYKAEELIKSLSEDPELFACDIRFYNGYHQALQDAIELQKSCILSEKTWEIHFLDLRTEPSFEINPSLFNTYQVFDEFGRFIIIAHDTSVNFVSAAHINAIYLVLHNSPFNPQELRQELGLSEDLRYVIATKPLKEGKFIDYVQKEIKHFFTLGSCDDSLAIDESWVESLMQYSDIADSESESLRTVRPAFGLSEISTRLAEEYASTITKLFSDYTDIEPQNISTLKGMCNRCIKHDQPDWKTTHQYLGYPDKKVLKSFVADSLTLRNDLRLGLFDSIVAYREKYRTMLLSMLNNLSLTEEN